MNSDFDDFSYRVYQDEPIIIPEINMESRTPPIYRAMRKIAMTGGYYSESYEKIFYKQGKFMERLEDDFDYREEFAQYFPTYQSMSDRQLRGYFSWRTKVRHCVIEKTSISFVFVYIYELINQIGVRSAIDGFHKLKNFWTAYRKIDLRIDSYVKLWLKDYVVYNNLDKSLLEDLLYSNYNNALLTLHNYKSHGADEVFSALNSISSYDLRDSGFFKRHPDDVKNVTYDVFSALSDHYDKDCKTTLGETFFGVFYTSSYYMFNSAVFYDRIRRRDFVYEIDEFCTYSCKKGNWSCKSFFHYGNKNQRIGALLKTIDFNMRKKFNFRSTLKVVKTSEIHENIINNTIDNYQEKQKEAARPKIEIDVSKLQNIRKAALQTQSKLLVDEDEPEKAAAPEFFDKKPVAENDIGLSDIEYLFMKCLLYGKAYDDQVQSNGLLLSVLVDAINGNLFDRFGDTIIIENGGRPELIADYLEELKEIIRE